MQKMRGQTNIRCESRILQIKILYKQYTFKYFFTNASCGSLESFLGTTTKEIVVDGFDFYFCFRTTRNAKLDVLGFS